MSLIKNIFYIFQVIGTVCCVTKSSLTFVIDDTGSMTDDIQQVKQQTKQIFNIVHSSKRSQIDNFVLVTFNDPASPKLRANTRDVNVFMAALDGIYVDGGDDCPELAMGGIELAVHHSLPDSNIFVFTDASALDYKYGGRVQKLAQDKSCQIDFVLTGICSEHGGMSAPHFKVYGTLAEATRGSVFIVGRHEVTDILNYVKKIVQEKQPVIRTGSLPPGHHTVPLPIDDTIKSITATVTGGTGKVETLIRGPSGKPAEIEPIVDKSSTKIVTLKTPVPGLYTLEVDSSEGARFTIAADTSVYFENGFSLFKTLNFNGTTARPFADAKSSVLIRQSGDANVLVKEIIITDKDNVELQVLPVKITDEINKVYVTDPVLPPSGVFLISVRVYDKANGTTFTRLVSSPIEAIKISAGGDEIVQSIAPHLSTRRKIVQGHYRMPLSLTCRSKGYPLANITWIDVERNVTIDAKTTFKEPHDSVSTLRITPTRWNTYRCVAVNAEGKATVDIIVKVDEKPLLDKSSRQIHALEKTTVEIPCLLVYGYPYPNFTWRYEYAPKRYKFVSRSKVLRLRNVEKHRSGKYICTAENTLGSDIQKVSLFVNTPPRIEAIKRSITITDDNLVFMSCKFDGYPHPNVTWEKDGRRLLHDANVAVRVATIKFRARVNDTGTYVCTATNEYGKAAANISLTVHVPVHIMSPSPSQVTLRLGGTLSLPCLNSGVPEPTVQWQFRHFDAPNDPIDVTRFMRANGMLYTPYVKNYDSGYYTCIARNTVSSYNITYTVNVLVPPKITTEKVHYTAVDGDLILEVPCESTGYPQPSIQWEMNNNKIIIDNIIYSQSENGTLKIIHVDDEAAGVYQCVAKNEIGVDTKAFSVEVESYPETDSATYYSKMEVQEGDDARVPCSIPHVAIDYLRWYRDGILIKDGELDITNADPSLSGEYICRVSSYKGSQSAVVDVAVMSSSISTLRFIDEDAETDFETPIGTEIDLDCSTDGAPPAEIYLWQFNKTQVFGESHFAVTVNDSTVGTYVCAAYNERTRPPIVRYFTVKAYDGRTRGDM